jgi:nicotinate-nucleotide adenylyltransferase
MLALATNDDPAIRISATELENPELPFTVETQLRVISEFPEARIFFVIGADSWSEISTWREWERVLTQTNIIVITRPGYSIAFSHVTDDIRRRIVDLRGGVSAETDHGEPKIYITDAVNIDVSASRIRQKIREGGTDWRSDVPEEVAKYLEKYQIYN